MTASLAPAPTALDDLDRFEQRRLDADAKFNRLRHAENSDEEVLKVLHDLTLVTARSGPLANAIQHPRTIAAFQQGLILATEASAKSPQLRALIVLAESQDIALAFTPVIVSQETIDKIYATTNDDFTAGTATGTATVAVEEQQRYLAHLLAEAATVKASDIHIRTQADYTEIQFRENKLLREHNRIERARGEALMTAIKNVASGTTGASSPTQRDIGILTAANVPLPDNVFSVRLNYTPTTDNGGAMTLRLLYKPKAVGDLSLLGYSADHIRAFARMRKLADGGFIISAPTSHGKTTLLQSILGTLLSERRNGIHLLTIEEPAELYIKHATNIAVTSTDEKRVKAFNDALRDALRMDPDAIVPGELRDMHTAQLALEAVETGHAVWTTLHTINAMTIPSRLTTLGLPVDRIAAPEVLQGLIAQRLIGVVCKACAKSGADGKDNGEIEPGVLKTIDELTGVSASEIRLRNEDGCEKCRKTGYSGVTVVAEIIETDERYWDLYVAKHRADLVEHWLAPRSKGGLGGKPMMHHALTKVAAGLFDPRDVDGKFSLIEDYPNKYGMLRDQLQLDVDEMRTNKP